MIGAIVIEIGLGAEAVLVPDPDPEGVGNVIPGPDPELVPVATWGQSAVDMPSPLNMA